ncbi:184_t:CDS:2, partial [Funneliformis geosporum]
KIAKLLIPEQNANMYSTLSIENKDDRLIIAIIKRSPNLRHIEISGNDINDKVTEALAYTYHKLEYLDLKGSDKHISFQETSPTPIVRKIPYNQKVEQGIIQEEGQDLAQLFSDAKVAEGRTLEAKRKELVTEKTAKSQVYAMIKASLSNVSDSNLYKKTERAGSFYKLFGKIIDPATKKEVMGIENSFLSADLDDYINILLGSFDDKTANWDTAYENSARVEKEEVNEVK